MAAPAVWRGFHGGTKQGPDDAAGIPPDYDAYDIFAEGPWPTTAAPWLDALEDPDAPGLGFVSPDPSLPRPDLGAEPIVGPFMPWELGPVTNFGEEQQNVGRTMRFPTNPLMDGAGGNGTNENRSYADELAAAIAYNGQGAVSDNEVYSNLIMFR